LFPADDSDRANSQTLFIDLKSVFPASEHTFFLRFQTSRYLRSWK
jgi:hypothetical protein